MVRRRTATLVGLTSLAVALAASSGTGAVAQPVPPSPASAVSVLRVSTTTPRADATRLAAAGFDLVESRVGTDLLVMGDAGTLTRLTAAGYRATVFQTLPAVDLTPRSTAKGGSATTFYGGYQTADEYVAHLGTVETAYPGLARTFNIGDSWLKTQNPDLGSVLRAICITQIRDLHPEDCQLTATPSKPRFVLLGTVHARELTPTELATRWVDELTSKYGVDAEVTALVRSTELWVLPLANPDGREIAEGGTTSPYLQRKNANSPLGSGCASPPTATNQGGVDINRNFGFLWGGVGTSTSLCAQTYKGVSAASEPETAAIQSLFTTLFPDQRGPAITDAAPLTTPGYMLTLHSYANMVLIPWGHTNTASPNDAGLRSAAFRLTYYNAYQAGQPGQILYNTTGTTDDWTYGQLGIASATMEVGPNSGTCSGFVPAYSCQTTFWNLNRPVLMYAAKLARAPYQLALGPNTRNPAVSPASVAAGTSVTVSGTADDAALGSSGVGKPATQRVTAGRYFVDTPPWDGGSPVAMTATDGSFNSKTEGIRATFATTGWASGTHTVYVQGQDASGNWGPVSAVFLTVT